MPTIIGARAAVDLALPSGIDGSRVLSWQMRSGKTAQQVIAEAAAAIGTVNEAIATRYSRLYYLTDAPYAYYAQGTGGNRKTPVKVEFKQADGARADVSGHMLPWTDYEDALAWTPQYLREATQALIDADLALITSSWQNRVETEIFTRMFSNAEESVGTGKSVPWSIGSGVSVPYIPAQHGGFSFDSTHTHFKFKSGTGAANAKALLEIMISELVHHGITGRLVAYVSLSDVTTYAGMTGFVKYVPAGITTVAGSTNAPVFVTQGELEGMPGELFGFYLSDRGPVVELRSSERIPTTYAWMGKSYGANSPQNPIAIRYDPATGFGMRVDPQISRSINPELEKVLFKHVHGVGVNQRLNGVAGQFNADAYTPPTIA